MVLVESVELFLEVGQQAMLLQGGESRSSRLIQLIEVVFAGKALAEFLESEQLRLRPGLFAALFFFSLLLFRLVFFPRDSEVLLFPPARGIPSTARRSYP